MPIKCSPISRKSLRDYAFQIRKSLNLDKQMYFPVLDFLDVLPEIFPNFTYEILEDHMIDDDKHAITDVKNEKMYIKQSVYDGASNNVGRDRFTIAHEIGHYLLISVNGMQFARSFEEPKVYENPEWQADVFAAELLVPHHLISRYKRPSSISKKCGVSIDCARCQLNKK